MSIREIIRVVLFDDLLTLLSLPRTRAGSSERGVDEPLTPEEQKALREEYERFKRVMGILLLLLGLLGGTGGDPLGVACFVIGIAGEIALRFDAL